MPGLIAALVWMALIRIAELPSPLETARPVAETMPSVTVSVRPSGLPIASTIWPTRAEDERPNDAYRRRGYGLVTPRSVHSPLGSDQRLSWHLWLITVEGGQVSIGYRRVPRERAREEGGCQSSGGER